MKVSADAVTDGEAKTFISTESFEEHPVALVAVTIYCIVLVGDAIGLFIVESDKSFEGVHEKVFPALLVVANTIEEPLHTAVSFRVVTSGKGRTFTITVSCEEQPLALVAVTMYCVVSVGEATGFFVPESDK